MAAIEQKIDKTRVAVFKKGEEPSDVVFWLTRPPVERITALEQIIRDYNLWKYGTEPRLERVHRVAKREWR